MLAISGGDNNQIKLWDIVSAEEHCPALTGHEGGIYALTVGLLDGIPILASGSWDKTLRFWNLKSGDQLLQPLTGHNAAVMALAVVTTPDRTVILSGSWDNSIRLWDLRTRMPIGVPLRGHDDGVMALSVFSSSGRPLIVSASWDHTVRLWDIEPDELQLANPTSHQGEVQALTVIDGGRLNGVLSASENGILREWSGDTGLLLREHALRQDGRITCLASIRTGTGRIAIVSGNLEGELQMYMWTEDSGSFSSEGVGVAPAPIMAIAEVSIAGRRGVAIGSTDNRIRIYAEADGALIAEFCGHDDWITGLAQAVFSGESFLVSTSMDHTLRTWPLADEIVTPVAPSFVADSPIMSLAARHIGDSCVLAVGCEDGSVVQIENITNVPLIATVARHEGPAVDVGVSAPTFDPILASVGADHMLRVRSARKSLDIDLGSTGLAVEFLSPDRVVVATRMGISCIELSRL